ncbi:hypothetical protein VB714_20140 [Spirulina sp. 06S082]|nr:hypothetical protein [Spirulina sp. 06S082]
MQKRCARNRKRSKRRAIYCPIHGCYLDSVSQKHSLYVDSAQQLQNRGLSRRSALMLVAQQGSITVTGEWLEAFWCPHCETVDWYHVHRVGDRQYKVSPVPQELWQQAVGVIDPQGNVSVSEFTRRNSRMLNFGGVKDFRFM